MSKKKLPKTSTMTIDAMTIWESQKPRYNGFACGHGAHGKRGYNRNAMKRKPLDWQEENILNIDGITGSLVWVSVCVIGGILSAVF